MKGIKMIKKERFKRLVELGCIVCLRHYGVYTQPAIHHLTGIKYRSTGKKASYEHTIPLCATHHQYPDHSNPSIHIDPKLFAEMYGTQEELLDITNGLIK